MNHQKYVGKLYRNDLEFDTTIVWSDPKEPLVSLLVRGKRRNRSVGNDMQRVCLSDSVFAGRPREPDLHPIIMSDINVRVKVPTRPAVSRFASRNTAKCCRRDRGAPSSESSDQ